MKEFNEIDHRIAEKIGTLPEVAPPDFVRDAVMSAIKKEPKRWVPIYWWAGAFLGAIAIGAWMYASQGQRNVAPAVPQTELTTSANPELATTLPSEIQNQNTGAEQSTNTAAPGMEQTTSAVHAQNGGTTSAIASENGSNTTRNANTAAQRQSTAKIADTRSAETRSNVLAQSAQSTSNQKVEANTQIAKAQGDVGNPQAYATQSIDAQAIAQGNTIALNENAIARTTKAMSTLRMLPLFEGAFSEVKSQVVGKLSVQKPDVMAFEPVKLAPKNVVGRKSLEIYGGLRYADATLRSPRIEDQDYLALRNQTERTDLGWEAGARVQILMKRNLSLQTGLQLAQNTSVFHFDDVQVQIKPTSVGAVDSTYMTGVVRYKRVYHRMHTLDVPVTLGYTLRYRAFDVRLGAGAELNLGVRSRGGMMFDQDGQRITFNSEEAKAIYKSNIGGRLIGQAQISRQLKGIGRVFGEAGVAYQPFSSTRTNYPLTQKYIIGSLRVGYAIGF
jgi:hypothetical protein